MKTELFENADVTASIHQPSEHALGSLGITRGHFVYLFSDFEYHSVFVWTGIFSKTFFVWTRIFFMQIKKMRFQKYPDMCGRGLRYYMWTVNPRFFYQVSERCSSVWRLWNENYLVGVQN